MEELTPSESFKRAAREIMMSHKCHELIPVSGKVVVFDSQLKIKDAFLGLVEHDIKCAPLWNSVIGEFVGMITITDFIDILLLTRASKTFFVDEFGEQTCAQWNYVKQNRKDLQPSPEVLKNFQGNLLSIAAQENILIGAQMLHEKNIHRLPIVQRDPEKNVLCIVNHQRILRFLLAKMKGTFASILSSTTLGDLGVGTFSEACVCISSQTTLLDTLLLLQKHRVPAIPIVDADNHYIDAYSRSDVRYLAMDKMYDQLAEINVEQALSNYHSSRVIPTCLLSEDLETVFQRLLNTRKHACVVVDSSNVVLGIVSLSEIFAVLLQ